MFFSRRDNVYYKRLEQIVTLKITSLNVRGLRDDAKRREVFNWLRAKRPSICMLQEVHCIEKTNHLWKAEWGYQAYFTSFESNKAGVCILFNNNFNLQLQRLYTDPAGRFIICDLKANEKLLTLANIYAPNEDKPSFFQNFYDHLLNFNCEDIIIGGDFNLVLNIENDKKGGIAKTHQNSLKTVQEISENLDLLDVWRIHNPDDKRYTWRQRQPKVYCRLDFFLISQSVIGDVTNTDIVPGYKTDHSMITLDLSLHANSRGPGLWKLNTSLLTETAYVNLIKTTIKEVQDEYENDDMVNSALLWDMIKLKIREKSLKYAMNKTKKTMGREAELEHAISKLESKMENGDSSVTENSELAEQLNDLKSELERIIETRTKGSILRAKIKWHNEGEKNTKYFLNLEKRHYKQGIISQLKVDENNFITSDQEILAEGESFFMNLYTSNRNIHNLIDTYDFFKHENDTVLNDEQRNNCEGLLTERECLAALKTMEQGKTPGSDGLPSEFYRVFWTNISNLLINALNYAHETSQLSITQRRGVIKLIPKKDAEPYFIKNWRPLTLLNCDYKIAAKAVANRLKKVLPDLISCDQTGFMKGRFIGENIRLIDYVIRFTKEKNIPGLLLFLDFEKAFDTIEWPFIINSLQYFGFGPSVVNWVKCLYSNIESCFLNNGWTSNFFKIERGVRQGCPLSPYLFVLSVEVLAKAFKRNSNIRGIHVNQEEIKISQYADDTTLILNGSQTSLSAALNTLDDFGEASGLKLNSKKTEAIWIGTYSGKTEILLPERNFRWQTNKVKSLGVWFTTDPENTVLLNYKEKLEKINNILSNWKYRRLTLSGKITVLKSLVASQIVYVLAPLCTNKKIISEINKLFYLFLWNGKGDKIKRDIMINNYSAGGLKMIDILSFNKALKTTWIKKYLDTDNQGKWKLFLDLELKKFECTLPFTSNLNKIDIANIFKTQDSFLKEILLIWSEINFEERITSESQLSEQGIWYNSLVRINDSPIFFKEWYRKGITKVKHLRNREGKFLTPPELLNKYDIKVQPLAYCGIISALKKLCNTFNQGDHTNEGNSYESFSTKLMKAQKASKLVYDKLITKKSAPPTTSQQKWNQDCNLGQNEITWGATYQLAHKITKSIKLREFQFKLLHRRIPTNAFLTKIRVKENSNCSFCKKEPEKLVHLFWSCPKTALFWESIITRLKLCQIIPDSYSADMTVSLGLRSDSSKLQRQINFCFLIARHYIWLCKTKEAIPLLQGFLKHLKTIYNIQAQAEANNVLPKQWSFLHDIT